MSFELEALLQDSIQNQTQEFDPGSGRTLAACLTHASRAENCLGSLRMERTVLSGGRVSNA